MYSELMMREHGFDDDPRFRVVMHTDAIWRACRIILDVRMHRGELTIGEAIDFIVEHTSFERPNATAEVALVHVPPDLSAVVPARADVAPQAARRRAASPGRRVLAQGLPRHAAAQRLAADQLPSPAAGGRRGLTRVLVIPSIDLEGGRSRVVYWPGAAAGDRRADRSTGAHRRATRRAGRAAHPPHRLRGRPCRQPGQPRRGRGRRVEERGPAAARRRPRFGRGDPARVRGRSDAGRADHGHRRPARGPAGLPRGRRGLAGRRPRSAAGAAGRLPVATVTAHRRSRSSSRSSSAPASPASCSRTAGRRRTSSGWVRSFGRTMPRSW